MTRTFFALLFLAVSCSARYNPSAYRSPYRAVQRLSAPNQRQDINNDLLSKDGCWKNSYGRGVGTIPMSCNPNYELDGLLCYPDCAPNYDGVGPVCWQNCPSGWRDDGAFCYKPSSYGRGAGYTSQSSCQKHHQQCEIWGLLWYPVCAPGFYAFGCCVCSPVCPPGMTDIGISCAKHSYGRGVGEPTNCGPNKEYDAGLCYDPCPPSYDGIGPVCWHNCPSSMSDCGALCVTSSTSCTSEIMDMVTETVAAIVKLFLSLTPEAAAEAALDLLLAYGYPICD